MEKKNNKKLFAIIGGSVLAFILTIALSVSITLAYFGDSTNGSYTVKMDKAVTLNDLATEAVKLNEHALPGEGIDVEITATLTSTPVEGAFVAMKISTSSTDAANLTAPTVVLADGSTWTLVDGIYYYADGQNLKATTDTAVLEGSFVLPTTLTNDAAEDTVTITVEIVAIQGQLFHTAATDSTKVGQKIDAPTIANAVALEAFKDFFTAA